MTEGFGTTASKASSSRKSAKKATQMPQSDCKSETSVFTQQAILQSQEMELLAWEAGVYNPLGESALKGARALDAEEEDWLFLAKEVGWLQVDHELDAIYFTAPPPHFDEEKADWYVRSDLSTFLDSPEPLCQVVQTYPIPKELLAETLTQRTQILGWSVQETEAFIQSTVNYSFTDLRMADYAFLLLSLDSA